MSGISTPDFDALIRSAPSEAKALLDGERSFYGLPGR